MTHDETIKAMNTLVTDENLRRHHLAAGICMKTLAQYLSEQHKGGFLQLPTFGKHPSEFNPADWEIVGLLHDADYERTKDRPHEHGAIVLDEIRSLGMSLPEELGEAIKFHNKDNMTAKESIIGWAIYTCDELTGLIVACALVRPDKKLASVTPEFVLEKFKQPSFAKGALRERIALCEEKLGIKLDKFIEICLKSMQSISQELGL